MNRQIQPASVRQTPPSRRSIPIETMPTWMQRAYRGTDWGALIALALGVIAAWAFLFYPTVPRNNDLEHYIFRAADVGQAIREGRLYPRWSPHAQNGYGAPIPHFAPPLPTYVAGALDTLFVSDPALAVRLLMAVTLIAASGAVYAFTSRRTSGSCGIIAVALYVYSPYVGSTASYVTGDLPGVAANALVPAVLWALDGTLLLGRPRDVVALALFTAAILLTHIPAALCIFAISAIFVIWQVIAHRNAVPHLWLTAAGFGLGLVLAAFYWLPAWGEYQQVTWRAPASAFTERLTLSTIFSPYRLIDPGALVLIPQYTLGIPLVMTVIMSTLVFLLPKLSFTRRVWIGFFLVSALVLMLIGLLFMPQQVWLVGIISLCSVYAGAGACETALSALRNSVRFQRMARIALPLSLALVLALSAPVWIVPPPITSNDSFTPEAQIQYEQLGYGIAVLPSHEALPGALPPNATPNLNLIANYRTGSLNKIEINDASTGTQSDARVGTLEITSHSYNVQVRTLDPAQFEVLTTYFPGWAITSASVSAVLGNDPTTGLITLEVGRDSAGEILIELASTPLRGLGWFITWTAVIGVIYLAQRRAMVHEDVLEQFPMVSLPELRLTVMVLATFVLILGMLIIPGAPYPLSAGYGTQLEGTFELPTRTNVGLESLAYRIDRASYQAGEMVDFTMVWRTIRSLDVNYRVQAILVSRSTGETLQRGDLVHPGGYPTRRWRTGFYVPDHYTLQLSPMLPHGEYLLGLEVYNCTPSNECAPENRITFFSSGGESLGNILILPVILTIRG